MAYGTVGGLPSVPVPDYENTKARLTTLENKIGSNSYDAATETLTLSTAIAAYNSETETLTFLV